ncbi:ABC transporter substrate-binding protein [Phaeocystidibacter marisrubri]|uniref:ABC transporter substrate-binding protein n=1 Tax=Phaeocystidibacter marisrubri TaxID=1577780 RepID=A0A6L3ZHA3_9FLAO|nr:ABC transporter substrate-binding protein [Phaeocystidibacter marisrubri]KAB2817217.1 ABC transporter substrate-binding protein [Phaeocystidibacter marisrubri]
MIKTAWIQRSAVCLFMLIFSCSTVPEVPEETVFRYNESTGISTLDPAFAREQSSIWACNQLFNGLVQMNDDLEVIPCIAQSWTISDSGRTYTFALRDDVFFHSHFLFGEDSTRRVVASDFEYSFYRLTDPKTASPGAWVLQGVSSISATHQDTLVIHLKEPFSPFLGMLTMKYCSVVPREIVEDLGDQFGREPIGTGPFSFQWWSTDEKLVFRKNPLYFEFEEGVRLPYLEAVAIDFITDRQAAFLEFLKGDIDLLSGLDASYKDELLTSDGVLKEEYEGRFQLQKLPYLNTEYLAINQSWGEEQVISDVEFRRALNLSVDRVKMMRYLRNGIGHPADGGMIPSGLKGYHPARTGGYSFQPDSAKVLLEMVRSRHNGAIPSVTLNTTSNYLDLCEYLQSSWNKMGIPVEVEVLPAPTLREGKAEGTLAFFRASWIADYPDAENYLSLFYSENFTPNGPNYTFFSNAEYDRLYALVRASTEDGERIEYYQKMDSILVAESPVVPLFYDEVVRFVPRSVEGLTPNALNLLDLKRVFKSVR